MPTVNTIIKEIKNVPVDRLEDLYQLVNSLTKNFKRKESSRKNILSFGGAFKNMSSKDYTDMVKEMKKNRKPINYPVQFFTNPRSIES